MNFKNEINIDKIRADTPCINIYMNHAAASVPPMPVIEEAESYFRTAVKYGTKAEWVIRYFTERLFNAKKSIAKLTGASSDEIAFTLDGPDAMNIIANGMDFKPGDNIVLSKLRFICNVFPWLRLKESGVEIRLAKAKKPGFIDLDDLKSQIDQKTKVVAITHMPPSLGTIQPVKQIAQITHQKGSLLFLDACNTVGLVDIDVEDIGCDFMAVSGRKYMRGPTGTGFLFIKKEHICNIRPSYLGWKSGTWDRNSDSYKDADSIDRFAMGEPNFPGIFGLGKAAEYIVEIGGISQIENRVSMLTQYFLDNLHDNPNIEIYGPESSEGRAGLITFNLRGISSSKLSHLLNRQGIIVEAGHFFCPGVMKMFGIESVVRMCVHYWNTKKEIDTVVNLLKSNLADKC